MCTPVKGSSKRTQYGLPCLHVVVTFLDSQVCVKNIEKCLVLTYKTKWASGLGDHERPSPPSQSFSAGRFFVSGAALHVPAVPCARKMPEAPSTDEEPPQGCCSLGALVEQSQWQREGAQHREPLASWRAVLQGCPVPCVQLKAEAAVGSRRVSDEGAQQGWLAVRKSPGRTCHTNEDC